MTKEQECIEKSLEVRIASAKAQLDKLQKEGIPFDRENPLSGIIDGVRGGITWEEKISDKIKQILLLPLLPIVLLLVSVLLPFIYITHLRDVSKKKQGLKKEIIELEDVRINKNYPVLQYDYRKDKKLQATLSFLGVKADKDVFSSNIPKDNTLYSLWRLYGLDKTFSSDERIGLVRDWIDILYGKEVADKLNIEGRVQETMARNAGVSESFHESSNELHHNCILFMNPVDSVVRDLSKELPSYG